MLKNFLKIYRLTLIVLVLFFLTWLLRKNIVMQGNLFLNKDFCYSSRFISKLYPENRVGAIEGIDSNNCFQRIFIEPVYFKVKIPRTFDKAKVRVTYANPDNAALKLGLMKKRKYPLDWRFSLKDLHLIQENNDSGGNVWLTTEADFVAGTEHLNEHALEFIFSAPGLTSNRQEIKVKRIEIELTRPASNWSSFFRDLKNYFINKTKNVREKFK